MASDISRLTKKPRQTHAKMECIKIISLKRKKESTEYLKYYLFPHKLVALSSDSSKLKEYKYEDTTKVEEKLGLILKTKIGIGFDFVNENIDPVFYNQFNDALKGFDTMFENEKGIQYRFDRIIDSENNSFESPYSETDKRTLDEKYGNYDQLINLYSTFSSFNFRIDLDRHGMQYIYRFDLDPWDQCLWSDDEPRDKLNSELGKSLLEFIAGNEKPVKTSFLSRMRRKIGHASPTANRYYFFTKGLFSILDSQTEKIYSVQEYEPKYNKPAKHSDIVIHENAVVFMSYVWNRLHEDIFYSMKYK